MIDASPTDPEPEPVAYADQLARCTGATPPYSARTVHELFTAGAKRTPEAVAVLASGGVLRYAELDARSDALARRLRAAGVGRGDLVAVTTARDLLLPVALLGVLKTGAAFLPIDPGLPTERVTAMLDIARPIAAVIDEAHQGLASGWGLRLVTARSEDKPTPGPPLDDGGAGPDDLMYVMFTSGTTGEPKGVAITHRGVLSLSERAPWAPAGAGDVLSQLHPVHFDGSTFDLWTALLNGAAVAIAPGTRLPPADLLDFVRTHGVTTVLMPAGLMRVVVDECPEFFAGVNHLLTGGDLVSPGHLARIGAAYPGLRLTAVYGPTEVSVFGSVASLGPVDPALPVPIGRPIPGRELYVCGPTGRLAPPGTPGEILIGGDGLAQGYVNRPGLTADKFTPSPFRPGERVYRTGDAGKMALDGTVEFLGRSDRQLKVRGFRVELDEIETVISAHPAVRECLVRTRVVAGDKVLVCSVTVDGDLTPAELRTFASSKLPEYSVPSQFACLPAFPTTPNGKLDLDQIDVWATGDPTTADAPAALTPTETVVHDIWREALGLAAIDLDTNFFEVGGHSLIALRVSARVQRALGKRVPVSALIGAPTIRLLAALLSDTTPEAPAPDHPDSADDLLAEATGASPEQLAALLSQFDSARR